MSALPIKLPTRRTEDWRWADLSGLEALAAAGPANDAHPDVSPLWLDVPGPRLLFIDGRLVAGSSRLDEVEIAVFDGEMPVHPLAVKAVAQAGAGLRLRLGVDSPEIGTVQIVNFGTRGAAHVVHRIILDEDAHASVIETYAGQGWSNGFVDIVLARGARLMRTVRVLKGGGAHTELAQVSVAGAASYTGSVLVTGCDSARIETHALLAGPGAYAQSDGVLLGRGQQTIDAFNRFDHVEPGGTSKQVWRMVADDRATTSFAGRVAVARGAQKTDAVQSVKALLLSRTATANAKPELEIFADDVKCAHGATVGELNRDALFYLESRGIPPVEAKALLTESFIADALAGIGEEAARGAVTADAVAWLGHAG